MTVISFKNVGKTTTTVQETTLESSPIPLGIRTPVRSGGTSTDGIFAMNYEIIDQIKDNLRNLVDTNHGERVGLYDFGANLRELTLEITAREDFELETMRRIKGAVDKWMPYVALQGFELKNEFEQRYKTGIVSFSVTYDVPSFGILGQQLDIVMYVT